MGKSHGLMVVGFEDGFELGSKVVGGPVLEEEKRSCAKKCSCYIWADTATKRQNTRGQENHDIYIGGMG